MISNQPIYKWRYEYLLLTVDIENTGTEQVNVWCKVNLPPSGWGDYSAGVTINPGEVGHDYVDFLVPDYGTYDLSITVYRPQNVIIAQQTYSQYVNVVERIVSSLGDGTTISGLAEDWVHSICTDGTYIYTLGMNWTPYYDTTIIRKRDPSTMSEVNSITISKSNRSMVGGGIVYHNGYLYTVVSEFDESAGDNYFPNRTYEKLHLYKIDTDLNILSDVELDGYFSYGWESIAMCHDYELGKDILMVVVLKRNGSKFDLGILKVDPDDMSILSETILKSQYFDLGTCQAYMSINVYNNDSRFFIIVVRAGINGTIKLYIYETGKNDVLDSDDQIVYTEYELNVKYGEVMLTRQVNPYDTDVVPSEQYAGIFYRDNNDVAHILIGSRLDGKCLTRYKNGAGFRDLVLTDILPGDITSVKRIAPFFISYSKTEAPYNYDFLVVCVNGEVNGTLKVAFIGYSPSELIWMSDGQISNHIFNIYRLYQRDPLTIQETYRYPMKGTNGNIINIGSTNYTIVGGNYRIGEGTMIRLSLIE